MLEIENIWVFPSFYDTFFEYGRRVIEGVIQTCHIIISKKGRAAYPLFKDRCI